MNPVQTPTWPPVDTGHPAWVRCESGDDFLCTIHPGEHAYDCECPGIEEWALCDLDPYTTGGSPVESA